MICRYNASWETSDKKKRQTTKLVVCLTYTVQCIILRYRDGDAELEYDRLYVVDDATFCSKNSSSMQQKHKYHASKAFCSWTKCSHAFQVDKNIVAYIKVTKQTPPIIKKYTHSQNSSVAYTHSLKKCWKKSRLQIVCLQVLFLDLLYVWALL